MSDSGSPESTERGSRALPWALAFVGLFCVLSPAADWVLTNTPFEISRLTWRYQALGRLSQTLLTPVLGVAVFVGGGSLLRSRWLSRIGGWLGTLGTLILAAMLGLFLLDMAGAQSQVRDEALAIFRVGAIRAVLKFGFATVCLGLLGWVGVAYGRGGSVKEKSSAGGADAVVFRRS